MSNHATGDARAFAGYPAVEASRPPLQVLPRSSRLFAAVEKVVGWYFPDERKFFKHLTEIAARLTTIAGFLEEALDEPPRLPESIRNIDRVERETDVAAHDLDINLDKLLIPPLDREDLHLLSTQLSRIADFIGGTARRAVSLGATERREPAVALARQIRRAVREIEVAVGHIRNGDEVLARCRAAKQAEAEGDAVWEAAVAELFVGTPDPIDVIRWKTLYDQLEDTLDACEDVADELETIAVKHA
jgi:uncharacterized protein Yka (UPF0111/DUF47 family)